MEFNNERTAFEWTCYRTGFHDQKNYSNLKIMLGVIAGIMVGWKLSELLFDRIPEGIFAISIIIAVLIAFIRMIRIVFRREDTIMVPAKAESFSFTLSNSRQILWKAEMENGSIQIISLYKNGFRIRKIEINGKIWYLLKGKPTAEFADMAKATEEETCYAVTNLTLHIKQETIENNDVISCLDAMCTN